MKGVFWFLGLAAVAAALALLVGDNQAIVTLFWPPYRVDLSFNLVLFGLMALFALLYGALRGIAVLRALPDQARRWRTQQLERAVLGSVLDALAYQLAGRFVRARASARHAIEQMAHLEKQNIVAHDQVHVLAHLLAAESAHALGDQEQRDAWLRQALEGDHARHAPDAKEGALLRAATWAIEDSDAQAATSWLADLPQGAARRIQTQRLKLRLARLRGDTAAAIEGVRLLVKHRAYSPEVAHSLLQGFVLDAFRSSHDQERLLRQWNSLSTEEKRVPGLALAALERWGELQGAESNEAGDAAASAFVRDGLLTVWESYGQLDVAQRSRFLLQFERALPELTDEWLSRIEQAQQKDPADVGLQYLAGQACMQRQLWGKAAHLLGQASVRLEQTELSRRAWRSLALLAEQRGDQVEAQAAWKRAALL